MDGSIEGGGPARAGRAALPQGCPHCRGVRLQRWGVTGRGVARLRCGGCRRTFSLVTGTRAAGLRRRAAFEAAVGDMLGAVPSSCRSLARRLGVHHMTVWRWRIRMLAHCLRHRPPAPEGGVVQVRESRKASREWVRHERWPAIHPPPPRPRWYALPRGESPPGGWAAWRIALCLRVPSGDHGPQAGFERFLAPFRGPASRYLAGYAAWMEVRAALTLHGPMHVRSTSNP